MSQRPSVGLGVFVFKSSKFLMLKRLGSHGSGTWSIPGGHLEHGESIEQGAKREMFEETGVKIKNVRIEAVTNDVFKSAGKHSVTIWVFSDYAGGKPTIKEPRKATELAWRDFKSLPKPLFEPCWRNLKKVRPDLFR